LAALKLGVSTKDFSNMVWKGVLKLLPEIHTGKKAVQPHNRHFLFITEANCVYFSFITNISHTKDQQLQFIAFLGPLK